MNGVRRVLNRAADSALATRHAEAWYVATVLATAAASWALLTIARALTAAPAPSPTVTPSTPAPTLTPGCVRSGGGWLCYGTTPPTP